MGHVKVILSRYRQHKPRFRAGAGRKGKYDMAMLHFDSPSVQYMFFALAAVGAAVLLFVGYRLGRWVGTMGAGRLIASKEQELFMAQKGFKNVYEQELAGVRKENSLLMEKVKHLEAKVEDYRKKAAGFGGLFGQGQKRVDAMYALLLENEALEEALMAQNDKLRQERTDSLKEQMRSTGYRRVLMSQLLNDERIKNYVAEVMADEKRLPAPSSGNNKALPENGEHA